MWNDLTMSERADVIKMAVKAGLRDMKSIRKFYDDSLKYEDGGPKVTLVDNDKVRISPSGTFSDGNGNIIGDSVILPELTVRAHKGYKSSFNPYVLISPNSANIIESMGKGIVKGVSSINKKDREPIREAGIAFLNNLNPNNRLDALDAAMHSTQGGEVISVDDLIEVGIPNYIKKITGKPMDINYTGSYLSDGITPNTKRDLVNLYLKGDTTGFEDVTDNSYYHNGPDYKKYFKENYPNVNPRTYKMYSDGIPLELNEEEYEEAMNNLDKIIRITEGSRSNADNTAHYNRWYKNIDGKLYAIDSDVWDFNPKDWSWEHGDEETANRNGTPFILKAIRPVIKKKTSTNKKAEGGSIHIAPSKRGTFTAAATKHDMGVQEFASKVLANKGNYSSTMVKKANFAKNASKWKHCLGGYLFI